MKNLTSFKVCLKLCAVLGVGTMIRSSTVLRWTCIGRWMEITSVLIGSDPLLKWWLQCSRLFPLVEIFIFFFFFRVLVRTICFLGAYFCLSLPFPKKEKGGKNTPQNFEVIFQIGFLYRGIAIPLDGNFLAFQDYQRKASSLSSRDVAGDLPPGNWFFHDKLGNFCPSLRCWSCMGFDSDFQIEKMLNGVKPAFCSWEPGLGFLSQLRLFSLGLSFCWSPAKCLIGAPASGITSTLLEPHFVYWYSPRESNARVLRDWILFHPPCIIATSHIILME